jgi:RimJ/RimL family protein N-acetyltransferase
MAGFYRERLLKGRHKGRILGVYGSAHTRGWGICRALMRALLERIRTVPGVEQVTLVVSSRALAPGALYVSLGFESYGAEPRALTVNNSWSDEEYMVFPLDQSGG